MQFIEIPENRYCSVKLSFARANPNSDYIRILQLCDKEPKTLQQIYPEAGYSALAAEVVALAHQGYLRKFSTPKYIKTHTVKYAGVYNTYRKVWYGTTSKGRRLVESVLPKD